MSNEHNTERPAHLGYYAMALRDGMSEEDARRFAETSVRSDVEHSTPVIPNGFTWEFNDGDFGLYALDTSEDPCTDHGFDVCPDCGNSGTKIDGTGYVSCTRFLTCWTD